MKPRKGRGANPSPCCGRRSEALHVVGDHQVAYACSICRKEFTYPPDPLRLVLIRRSKLRLVWSDRKAAQS
jgi:hypothetical protein